MYLLREIILSILEIMYLRYFDIYDVISVILYQNIFHVFRLFSISSLNKKLILEFIYIYIYIFNHLTTLIIFEKALRQSAQLNIEIIATEYVSTKNEVLQWWCKVEVWFGKEMLFTSRNDRILIWILPKKINNLELR